MCSEPICICNTLCWALHMHPRASCPPFSLEPGQSVVVRDSVNKEEFDEMKCFCFRDLIKWFGLMRLLPHFLHIKLCFKLECKFELKKAPQFSYCGSSFIWKNRFRSWVPVSHIPQPRRSYLLVSSWHKQLTTLYKGTALSWVREDAYFFLFHHLEASASRAGREPLLLSVCASTAGSNVATPVGVSCFIPDSVQDKRGMPAHCSSFWECSPETLFIRTGQNVISGVCLAVDEVGKIRPYTSKGVFSFVKGVLLKENGPLFLLGDV